MSEAKQRILTVFKLRWQNLKEVPGSQRILGHLLRSVVVVVLPFFADNFFKSTSVAVWITTQRLTSGVYKPAYPSV